MSVILKYASSVEKVHILRTLATDIGVKLGFPAHMSKLTRIESGGFVLKDNLH